MGKESQIEWKGATWRAAYGNLSVKELLTILKGHGPMEILEFERPGYGKGHLSLSLTQEGTKEITLYHLEVQGPNRQGQGRAILQWLKKNFKGELYVQDPGFIRVRNADAQSLLFWVKMFREGLVDAVDSPICDLNAQVSEAELTEIEQELKSLCQMQQEPLADHDFKRENQDRRGTSKSL